MSWRTESVCNLRRCTHLESKNAIYDAMFGDAWSACLREFDALKRPRTARAAMKLYARSFFDFAVREPARHQLMNLRTIPRFEPSPQSYAPYLDLDQKLWLLANRNVDERLDKLIE